MYDEVSCFPPPPTLVTWQLYMTWHLSDVLQPASRGHKHEQHGRRVEEGHGAGGLLEHHSRYHHAQAVHVRHRRGQHDEHVHVGGAVAQGLDRLHVEVTATNELQQWPGVRGRSGVEGQRSFGDAVTRVARGYGNAVTLNIGIVREPQRLLMINCSTVYE